VIENPVPTIAARFVVSTVRWVSIRTSTIGASLRDSTDTHAAKNARVAANNPRTRGSPTPGRALGEAEQQADQPEGEQRGTGDVERGRRPLSRRLRDGAPDQRQRYGHRDGREGEHEAPGDDVHEAPSTKASPVPIGSVVAITPTANGWRSRGNPSLMIE